MRADDRRGFGPGACVTAALTPDRPKLRGTAQNPDVFFQARETVNPYYNACPEIVQKAMDKFAKVVGRQYHLFDYRRRARRRARHRHDGLGRRDGARDGRLSEQPGREGRHDQGPAVSPVRPEVDSSRRLPETVKNIAVLDRTKEPGADGEPLYKDV
jgi:pyruvate-ferredoxin/flavodoxin oxidoreductase